MSNNEKLLIGITTEKENSFMEWYREMIVKSELIDYSDISGCYVLMPRSYNIWEKIQKYVDTEIKKMGVENAYFPLFVSKNALETEKNHIEGFAPEVAWITRSGKSDLAEPIAVRPTSETIMYPLFSKWLKSHRDLPFRINQWCNIVRWEFKDCIPFLRSREFLWQEGHTCHNTEDDARLEVNHILNIYKDVYEKLLAIPVIIGHKSEKEKFAGAECTATVECFIPTIGKAIQSATSHYLGQNFSKMFNIAVENTDGCKSFVHQNSWGITTRTIGVMAMVHGDNKGLVLPPIVAPVHVVIIQCGITSKLNKDDVDQIDNVCNNLQNLLNENGIVCKMDNRTNYRVGYKFNYWELRGVPIRLEIGPKDVKNNNICIARRDTGDKINFNPQSETGVVEVIRSILDDIQNCMYNKALEERNKHIKVCSNIDLFAEEIVKKNMCLVPWCNNILCEENISTEFKNMKRSVKSLCIPYNQNLPVELTGNSNSTITDNTKCFNCSSNAQCYALFGSSF